MNEIPFEVSFEHIASSKPEDVRKVGGFDESVPFPKACLDLAMMYYKQGSLDRASSVLVHDNKFSTAWLMSDKELATQIKGKKVTRYMASILASKSKFIIDSFRFRTFVFVEETLNLDDKFISAIRGDNKISLSTGFPDPDKDLPISDDVILLITGREGNEDTARINNYIETYGPYDNVTLICVRIGEDDLWCAQFMPMCTNWGELIEYVMKPVDKTLKSLTYYLSGSFIPLTMALDIELRSWTRVKKSMLSSYSYIDILISKNVVDEKNELIKGDEGLYRIESMLGSNFDVAGTNIVTKGEIGNTVRSIYPDLSDNIVLPQVRLVSVKSYSDMVSRMPGHSVYIVKSVVTQASGGIGIYRIYDQNSYIESMKKLKKWLDSIKTEGGYKVDSTIMMDKSIVTPYVNNPYTIDKRKFHLRMMILVTSWGVCDWFPIGKCIFAKEEYKQGEYENDSIHDTHMSTSPRYVQYPKDLTEEQVDHIKPGLKKAMEVLLGVTKGKFWPYSESKLSFVLFGADILPDEKGNAWILEVNRHPWIREEKRDSAKSMKYMRYLFEWVMERTVRRVSLEILSPVKIIPLEESSERQRDELLSIYLLPDVFPNIGGKKWTKESIEELYKNSLIESKKAEYQREYFDWILVDNDTTVGYISLRPGVKFGGKTLQETSEEIPLQVRLFVGKKRAGYGKKALTLIQSKIRTARVYAIVSLSNIESIALFESGDMYSLYAKSVMAYGKLSNVYVRKG